VPWHYSALYCLARTSSSPSHAPSPFKTSPSHAQPLPFCRLRPARGTGGRLRRRPGSGTLPPAGRRHGQRRWRRWAGVGGGSLGRLPHFGAAGGACAGGALSALRFTCAAAGTAHVRRTACTYAGTTCLQSRLSMPLGFETPVPNIGPTPSWLLNADRLQADAFFFTPETASAFPCCLACCSAPQTPTCWHSASAQAAQRVATKAGGRARSDGTPARTRAAAAPPQRQAGGTPTPRRFFACLRDAFHQQSLRFTTQPSFD
jgi:hypothetical protein